MKTAGDYYMYMAGNPEKGDQTMTTTRRDSKYAILANDIDCGVYGNGTRLGQVTLKSPAGAVLDGRGFIVSGLDAQYTIFGYGYDSDTNTIKDYTVKNISFSEMYGGHWPTLARLMENCKFENVNFGVKIAAPSCQIYRREGNTSGSALLADRATNVEFTNCSFRFFGPSMDAPKIRLFTNQSSSVTFNNTSFSTRGLDIAMPGETDGPSNVVQTWTMTEGSTYQMTIHAHRLGGSGTLTATNDTVTITQINEFITARGANWALANPTSLEL